MSDKKSIDDSRVRGFIEGIEFKKIRRALDLCNESIMISAGKWKPDGMTDEEAARYGATARIEARKVLLKNCNMDCVKCALAVVTNGITRTLVDGSTLCGFISDVVEARRDVVGCRNAISYLRGVIADDEQKLEELMSEKVRPLEESIMACKGKLSKAETELPEKERRKAELEANVENGI